MEVAALVGLLGLGYVLTRAPPQKEGFVDGESTEADAVAAVEELKYGGQPPPLYPVDRTPAGAPTVPGKPRQPRPTADGSLDSFYRLPSGAAPAADSPAT